MPMGHHNAWPLSGHLRPPDDHHDSHAHNLLFRAPSRPHTPQLRRGTADGSQSGQTMEGDTSAEDDPRLARFRNLFNQSESKIAHLFSRTAQDAIGSDDDPTLSKSQNDESGAPEPALEGPPRKKRKLDEDDYNDFDDDDEDDEDTAEVNVSPLKAKSIPAPLIPAPMTPAKPSIPSPLVRISSPMIKPNAPPKSQKEEAEDARRKLEEAKRAETEAVKRASRLMFFTLENDRDAMLDQQRLDEAERRAEAEAEGQNSQQNAASQQGSLAKANLGASSLTLKNLIARIDQHRTLVTASESELRSLMSEVRKNRSKWANEDKVGQEELYEAAEKVLGELKAMSEHSTPFLNRVNKRDAPDYYNIIKHPMDLGTMTKKLKQLAYKSKKDFVDELNLIWANCLKYNANPEHFLRKHALYMRKETEKLVPLIPDIVIRDRAEVEAEERRQQLAAGGLEDGAEESDDEPIMSSRGRKAPGKSAAKKSTTTTKEDGQNEGTPNPDVKPLPNGLFRADSELGAEGSQGQSTPPPGTMTPLGAGGGFPDSQSEMDIDAPGTSVPPMLPVLEHEDEEYKLWKQKTKKDRALWAAARHRLFKGNKLDPEETAMLRSKAGMKRWLRTQSKAEQENLAESDENTSQGPPKQTPGDSLAEEIEEEQETMLPADYDVVSAVPEIPSHQKWEVDGEGNVVDHSDEFLRLYPKEQFVAPQSKLTKKMTDNMRQMQDTRKICAKIGIVKQMQLQSQIYQNQFQKYNPEPFREKDIDAHVMTDEGPVMAPWVCKAALQRSTAQIFYHAGFEEFQPSALDAITEMAADFMQNLTKSMLSYAHAPKVSVEEPAGILPSSQAQAQTQWRIENSPEQIVIHSLHENGISLPDLEVYARDEVDRLATKLGTMHERMKAHLADLLRPALNDGSVDGSAAFNDGSEQFVGGDFAEDIDEDFFGFKELGLDKEFGLAALSVPLHLLQNRMYTMNQTQNASGPAAMQLFTPPSAYPKISKDTISREIGLVKNFYMAKLHANNDEPLVEDLELPPKQRPNGMRPRLPASGKIGEGTKNVQASPAKRPPPSASKKSASNIATVNGETEGPSKKKKKSNTGQAVELNGDSAPLVNGTTPSKKDSTSKGTKLKISLPAGDNNGDDEDAAGEDVTTPIPETNGVKMNGSMNGTVGEGESAMMSPESI